VIKKIIRFKEITVKHLTEVQIADGENYGTISRLKKSTRLKR
jgi:hypothetical protein